MFKRIAIITALSIAILLVGGYFAMDAVTNRIFEELASSALTEGADNGADQAKPGGGAAAPGKTPPPAAAPNAGNEAPPAAGTGSGGDGQTEDQTGSPEASAKPPAGTQQGSGQPPVQTSDDAASGGKPKDDAQPPSEKDSGYTPNITPEKAEEVKEQVTMQEKMFVMTTLMKKFSKDEVSLFMKMASGGMSVAEKKEAKKIFLEKLTEDEYNQMISIAAKYGLSQGKSYQDSLDMLDNAGKGK